MKPATLHRFAGVGMTLVLLILLGAASAARTSYTVQPDESTIIYSMDHPMHAWSGTSHEATGTIEVDENLAPVSVRLQAPVMSFNSGNKSRDSHMAETVEFYAYPNVVFQSTSITPGAADAEGRPTWDVKGKLTFHGVTKPIESLVHVSQDAASLVAKGTFDIALTDYEIELPSLLSIKVKDWMKLEFDIHAQARTASAKN